MIPNHLEFDHPWPKQKIKNKNKQNKKKGNPETEEKSGKEMNTRTLPFSRNFPVGTYFWVGIKLQKIFLSRTIGGGKHSKTFCGL